MTVSLRPLLWLKPEQKYEERMIKASPAYQNQPLSA